MSMSSSKRLYLDRSSSLPLSSSSLLELLEECRSFCASLEFLLLLGDFSFSLRLESCSLDEDELELRSRFVDGDFRERFRLLRSDDELDRERDRDLERRFE